MKKILFYMSLAALLFSHRVEAEDMNQFIVCDNSLEMLEWDMEFLRGAHQSIEIVACYAGGKVMREILIEIEKRLQTCPDLLVRILTAPLLMEDEEKKIVTRLQNTYTNRFHMELASSVLLIWPEIAGIDNHVKMMIVDEKYFSCGGSNLDQLCCEGTTTPQNPHHPMGPTFPFGARDQDIVGKGPLAKDLRKTFYKHYALWDHYNKTQTLIKDPDFFSDNSYFFPLEGQEKAFVEKFETSDRLVPVLPEDVKIVIGGSHQKNNAITQEYIRLVMGAKEEILIANVYFNPSEALTKAILDAIERGVKVTVITNGVNNRSPEYTKLFCWANRINYVPVFYGRTFRFWEILTCKNMPIKNSKIHEYYVENVLLHKKVMIVDGQKFVIGSYNLGTKSDLADYEMILSFNSASIAQEAKKIFKRDLSFSIEISPKEARQWYFDPFTAYMGEVQKKFHGMF